MEQLVAASTGIIFDATESVTSVSVNGVVVWSSGAPQNGWSGFTLVHPGGTRYVLDSPGVFTIGELKVVDIVGGVTTLQYQFAIGMRQITTTDDAGSPRIVETGDKPWVVYPRATGNINARKDDPLTTEVPVVPGEVVDIGYNEISGEIEIVYIQNAKVFVVVGDDGDTPSTLVQPSILKSNFRTGGVGDNVSHVLTTVDFPPIKQFLQESFVSGDVGFSVFNQFDLPPTTPVAIAFVGSPATIVVGPASSPLITAIRLFKLNTGAAVMLAELPYSTEIQVLLDAAYVAGDRYFTQSVYGDPGAPLMRRLTDRGANTGGAPGDVFLAGPIGDNTNNAFTNVNIPPLKYASPSEPFTTDSVGSPSDAIATRVWFPPTSTTASMATTVDGYILVTGLTTMKAEHMGLLLSISGAATAANNGEWPIVEIVSATSVRVRAPAAPGGDANNGALTWTVTGPNIVTPGTFMVRSTLNIGVGS